MLSVSSCVPSFTRFARMVRPSSSVRRIPGAGRGLRVSLQSSSWPSLLLLEGLDMSGEEHERRLRSHRLTMFQHLCVSNQLLLFPRSNR